MPTTVGILTFMSRKSSILGLSEPEKKIISCYFYTYEIVKFHAQLSLNFLKPPAQVCDITSCPSQKEITSQTD